jgi:hypothetical protein
MFRNTMGGFAKIVEKQGCVWYNSKGGNLTIEKE